MPLFVIAWKDRPGALDMRLGARADHLAYVAAHPGMVKLGGPFLDGEGRMAGSLMIVECEDLAAAERFHASDPYRAAGLFETSSVEPWRVTIGGLA